MAVYLTPMSITTLKARIDNELSMIGGFDDTDSKPIKSSIIADSVRQFIRKFEPDDLTATLAVSASVLVYAIPAAIEKISRIFDESKVRVYYTFDSYHREVTLINAPSGSVNYTVYGTPNKVSSNLDSIIAALDEDYEDVIWAYVRANCYKAAGHADWKIEYDAAEGEAIKMRQDRNRRKDSYDASMQFKDRTGRDVDDVDNIDNYTASNYEYGSLGDL